ncbi:class I SAM-dependent methyltransferase [bacterium]|nr:class I SAM-dependent methyltransferase [bacterium]
MNRTLYTAQDFPVFQNRMYDSAEEAAGCPKGQIELVEDQTSGLVRNAAFDPDLIVYDTAYQNEQANSVAFKGHLDWVAGLISRTMGTENLIEVGCGKGTFLNMLAERGADITGFDPAFEGSDPRIRQVAFDPSLGMNGKGLILRHVLEHIPDPVSFLQDLAAANGHQGLIYIEVPCFDWICDHKAWFDIFYEHVNYFRLSDFHRIFGNVVASGRCFGGQYLYVVGDLSTVTRPTYTPADKVAFPHDLTAALDPSALTENDVVWGGASKGVIYSLLRKRAEHPVRAVIDINPAKQGKYLAGTGLRVNAPDEVLPNLPPMARIMIMNPNYSEEIKAMAGIALTYVEVGA